MKDVKVVIGANYGDEGKGLMNRHFVLDAKNKGEKSIVILHNGTAQRGHTVDYNPNFRHVYHNFGCGTGDGIPTFLAETFMVHPMDFRREFLELNAAGIHPVVVCDPRAKVITPFDMLVDRATEEWIAKENGEREFGSCGYGSWCAAEGRFPLGRTAYTVADFTRDFDAIPFLMEEVWKDCLSILVARGVDIMKTSYAYILKDRRPTVQNFINDIKFFYYNALTITFDELWKSDLGFDSYIFENGQGLGLDVDVDNEWHTTSHTGIYNPYHMLEDKSDFSAEMCYVTRSYGTRHGVGPLEEATTKSNINVDMVDKTNMPNPYQGTLRYGYADIDAMAARIYKDAQIIKSGDNRFKGTICMTHLNELDSNFETEYWSNNPYTVHSNLDI